MELKLPNWRNEEASLDEVISRYPTLSPIIILKVDVLRRGYALNEKAKNAFKELSGNYQVIKHEDHFNRGTYIEGPRGLVFRDGASIINPPDDNIGVRDPYIIDYADGKFWLTDEEKRVEEIDFWRKADYFGKLTSKGTPMEQILEARPHRLSVFSANKYCYFWGGGEGCKFCSIGPNSKYYRKNPKAALADPEEIEEAVVEAFRQKGRFTTICTTAGSILSGEELFDDEVQMYIDIYSRLRRHFSSEKLRFQYVASAFSKKQVERLQKETGNIAYTTNLEVPTKELFDWICPGKARVVGFEGWKQRLYNAVDVFGKGNVNSQLVAGADLVQPNGFRTEAESVAAILALTEELAKHGVGVVTNVWGVVPTIIFKNFYPPSLDYYAQVIKGVNEIQQAYDINMYFDDYKRCGTHPSSDLLRV